MYFLLVGQHALEKRELEGLVAQNGAEKLNGRLINDPVWIMKLLADVVKELADFYVIALVAADLDKDEQ